MTNTKAYVLRTVELLGMTQDLALRSYIKRDHVGVPLGHAFRCHYCNGTGDVPPRVEHRDGCLYLQIQRHLNITIHFKNEKPT